MPLTWAQLPEEGFYLQFCFIFGGFCAQVNVAVLQPASMPLASAHNQKEHAGSCSEVVYLMLQCRADAGSTYTRLRY